MEPINKNFSGLFRAIQSLLKQNETKTTTIENHSSQSKISETITHVRQAPENPFTIKTFETKLTQSKEALLHRIGNLVAVNPAR